MYNYGEGLAGIAIFGFFMWLIGAAVFMVVFYFVMKAAVKNGIKSALVEMEGTKIFDRLNAAKTGN